MGGELIKTQDGTAALVPVHGRSFDGFNQSSGTQPAHMAVAERRKQNKKAPSPKADQTDTMLNVGQKLSPKQGQPEHASGIQSQVF